LVVLGALPSFQVPSPESSTIPPQDFTIGRRNAYALAVGGAVLFSAIQASRVKIAVAYVPWYVLFVFELPVWLWWVAVSPVVFAVARKFPLGGRDWPRNFAIHFVASLAVSPFMVITVNLIRELLGRVLIAAGQATDPQLHTYLDPGPFLSGIWYAWTSFFSFMMLIYFSVVAVHHLIHTHQELARKSIRESDLEASLSRAQLDLLRAQIQPHFLFNTLNTISGLMPRDITLAREVLTNLGELLRASLSTSDEHETTLAEELRGLEPYLAIVRARFGDHLRIDTRIDPDVSRALVPRMLFQPLVENAISHGMTESDDPLCIDLVARRRDSSLYLLIRDDGKGVNGNGPIVEGIGIGNTRRRLERLYPGRSTFGTDSREDGGFAVSITLPLRLRGRTTLGSEYD
jgi:two-component system LytT family sensor kinase